MNRPPIPFTGNPIDREAGRRRDRAWLEEKLGAEESRFLPFWQLQPLLKRGEEREIAWARRELFEEIDPAPEPVLLGTLDDVAHFAVDVSAAEGREAALGVEEVASFEDLRGSVAVMAHPDAAIASQGRAYVDWHARHRFCAVCGGGTRAVLGGAHRVCTECAGEHFPRTDPVGIAAVVRGDQCLLGRGPGWPGNMFSALAGFIEPGETLEEAVRREILEESGVRVGAVHYIASQPWTFPSSLMIGCLAEAESEEITVDRTELEEARWFSRDQLREALAGRTDVVGVPPPMAIAHHLIRAWVEEGEG
jgi:NAD+ diphosphatase